MKTVPSNPKWLILGVFSFLLLSITSCSRNRDADFRTEFVGNYAAEDNTTVVEGLKYDCSIVPDKRDKLKIENLHNQFDVENILLDDNGNLYIPTQQVGDYILNGEGYFKDGELRVYWNYGKSNPNIECMSVMLRK